VRFAVDAVEEGLLQREEAILTIDADTLDALLHPTFDPEVDYDVLARGVAASPARPSARSCSPPTRRLAAESDKRDVILVADSFTEADDVVRGFPRRSGASSPARAARRPTLRWWPEAWAGRACVRLLRARDRPRRAHREVVNGTTLGEGDVIAINGTTGAITVDDVPLIKPQMSDAFRTVLSWADDLRAPRRAGQRTTPPRPPRTRAASGPRASGLCRTEHIFLGEHQPAMGAADPRGLRRNAARTRSRSSAASSRSTSTGSSRRWRACRSRSASSTRRCTNSSPGLHETISRVERARVEDSDDLEELEHTLERGCASSSRPIRCWETQRRPCCGSSSPTSTAKQVTAVMPRGRAVRERTGTGPCVEVMIPLVDYELELELVRGLVEDDRRGGGDARRRGLRRGHDDRAPARVHAGRSDRPPRRLLLVRHKRLTQTTLGFSRDDIEKRILGRYIDMKILDRSPFETLDEPGVGQLVRMGAWLGRQTKPDLKLGICGEHGGDPDSIAFFAASGLDYVLLLALPGPGRAGVPQPRPPYAG